jgi:AraC-like DNA-binding protein
MAKLPEDALCALASACTYDARKFANALNVSPRQLQREFRRQFCCTPQAWLQAKRLEAARRMLCEAESVKAVAYTLGFPQLSQFSRDFKRHFGVTPSECAPRKRRSW